MGLNLEENYLFRKLALSVLAKALDDICPKFEEESPEARKILYKERESAFKDFEKELDLEWKQLESEAQYEVKKFISSRNNLFTKIRKSDKTDRIKKKVNDLEKKLKSRIKYLDNREKDFTKKIRTEMKVFSQDSKEYQQLKKRLDTFSNSNKDKIQKSIERYNKIISNFRDSNNSEKVKVRLEHSKEVWERKYEKLKSKFNEKVLIHETKRHEYDQIRISVQGFEEEISRIKHWTTLAGVPLIDCYEAVQHRLKLLGRKSEKIQEIIQEIKEKGEDYIL